MKSFKFKQLFTSKREYNAILNIAEVLKDQRDKHVDKDVHRDDIPGDEDQIGISLRTTITEGQFSISDTKGRRNSEISHDVVPILTETVLKQHDQHFSHGSPVLSGRGIRSCSRETEDLIDGYGKDKEQNTPSKHQSKHRRQRSRGDLQQMR
ncbi:hypothetical protein WICPIJ_009559 [Wickerhamomyces pijperi]|uniref:Uncharacterized protein n=1 Tax=Wickerhamomyces pijperi TaxID=599730 RepID=A0A9P8TCX1_WICPI|nr:hypothetical protein WICPIJ_009559 [Wickerhamomyces pijperi]